MLWTIAVILIILWLLGLVSSYTMGGFIHILLVLAIIVDPGQCDPGSTRIVNRRDEWIIVLPKRLRAVVVASLLALCGPASRCRQPRGRGRRARGCHAAAGRDLDAGNGTGLQKDYSWDKTGSVQPATDWPADEPKGRMQTMMQFAPALLVLVLVAVGLTITFTSLRKDMRQRRRVVYRPRGPRSTDGGEESH